MASFNCKNYHIIRLLESTDEAEVWEGEHKRRRQKAAIKVFHERQLAHRDVLSRLGRVAQAVAGLQHPVIPRAFGVGITSDRRAYVATELLTGEPLATRLQQQEPLAIDRALHLLDQLALAMQDVHELGIQHRHLTPRCLLLIPDQGAPHGERLAVVDFGIAHMAAALPPGATPWPQLLGPPTYAAPELCQEAGTVGPEADLYAMGAILYHSLCGRPPFTEDDPAALLQAKLSATLVRPQTLREQLPALLDQLIVRLLDPEPSQRPRTCEQLRQELESLAAPEQREWAPSGDATMLMERGPHLELLASLRAAASDHSADATDAPEFDETETLVADEVANMTLIEERAPAAHDGIPAMREAETTAPVVASRPAFKSARTMSIVLADNTQVLESLPVPAIGAPMALGREQQRPLSDVPPPGLVRPSGRFMAIQPSAPVSGEIRSPEGTPGPRMAARASSLRPPETANDDRPRWLLIAGVFLVTLIIMVTSLAIT